ncbi:hypothetical protein BKA01_004779 [Pseudonocardia eucalypti]|nr:hypothetical protein [Pseudonocardia eucalypti]
MTSRRTRGDAARRSRSLLLTVEDFAGVERVTSLLRGRRYDVRGLRASVLDDGGWAVELDVPADEHGLWRLYERLQRLPAVIEVHLGPGLRGQLADKSTTDPEG